MNVPTFEGNYFFLDKENAMSSMTDPTGKDKFNNLTHGKGPNSKWVVHMVWGCKLTSYVST